MHYSFSLQLFQTVSVSMDSTALWDKNFICNCLLCSELEKGIILSCVEAVIIVQCSKAH